MYVAMNRFRITPGREADFEAIWRNRETRLEEMAGFRTFHLLRGPSTETHTLYASHTVWDSEAAFRAWTTSQQFRDAHKNAGGHDGVYLGHPNFEGFAAIDGV